LLTTAEFGEIKDDIADMVKETGRVDASNITELAEECDYLNDIMEQTGITAEGMAKALTMIEDGTLDFHQLTDAVLASFKAFDGLESIISSVHTRFNDFNTTDR
jgi:tape measure domain-containing protein